MSNTFSSSFSVNTHPPALGYIVIGQYTRIAFYKKINWFQRKMIKWFFGWDVEFTNEPNTQLLQG